MSDFEKAMIEGMLSSVMARAPLPTVHTVSTQTTYVNPSDKVNVKSCPFEYQGPFFLDEKLPQGMRKVVTTTTTTVYVSYTPEEK